MKTEISAQAGGSQEVIAIVVAGGTGDRSGLAGGKQMVPLGGRPMLSHAISALDAAELIDLIVVACHPERVEEYRESAVEPWVFLTGTKVVPGGDERQDSVRFGLEAALESSSPEIVVVHDGARPLVTAETIDSAVAVLRDDPGAAGVVVGHPAYDTLKLVEADRVVETPERERFWVAQTPQVFRTSWLVDAHERALAEGFRGTDDASLVERIGGLVRMHLGPRENLKVTVSEDFLMAEAILRERSRRDGV